MSADYNSHNNNIYKIHKIRLINFHNFIDETIEVNNGGHLFLLGDNGSGKTTLLDAVHMVLTANDNVEFNAAARVAGSSRDGRRTQGIIMRQNIEAAAPLNPHGGITYAALEVDAWQGKPLTLALGMATDALDAQVQYWGVVKSCPLDELQLLRVDGENNSFPLSRRELRAALAGAGAGTGTEAAPRTGSGTKAIPGYCPDLKAYKSELIRRLYGGKEDLFKEAHRLLKMGKAYREIAAGTGDYHELFKKLLPDPQRELFERVIRTLQELDESNEKLEGLENKQEYLKGLEKTIASIERSREAALRYRWLIHHRKMEELDNLISQCGTQKLQAEGELNKCTEAIRVEQGDQEAIQRKLDALKQSDSSGLLNMQKNSKREEERLLGEHGKQLARLKVLERELNDAQRKSSEAFQSWQKTLKNLYDSLNHLRNTIPFSIASVLLQLDALQHLQEHELGAATAPNLNTANTMEELDREKSMHTTAQGELRRSITQFKAAASSLEAEIRLLKDLEEVTPPIPLLHQALGELKSQMIKAVPLYRGLEWKAGVSGEVCNAIEEAIGAEVLATLTIPAKDYEVAARVTFPHYPGVRLAAVGGESQSQQNPPAWIIQNFDMATSDPDAIMVLAAEMEARPEQHPMVLRPHNGAMVLRFRSHQRQLTGSQASYIGAESRRKALAGRLKDLQEKLKDAEKTIRASEKEATALEATQQALRTVEAALNKAPNETLNAYHEAHNSILNLTTAENQLADQRSVVAQASKNLQRCRDELALLQARIEGEGLDKLEEKQRKLTAALKKCQDQIDNLNQNKGRSQRQIDDQLERAAELNAETQREEASRQELEELLAPLAQNVESVAYYVLRTWRGQQFTAIKNIEEELGNVKTAENQTIGSLRSALHDPTFGAQYSFTYDEPTNRLVDRHFAPINEVVTNGQKLLEEQQGIINEKTQDLIRNIIMGDLFTELKGRVHQLRAIVKNINNHLDRRTFGNNGYRFRLEEESGYRDLLKVIERYNPLDPAAQDELKHFLEIHKDDITATEINDIPAVLDYRNWFRYELTMTSVSDVGAVVMNRKTKSLGSGGEQAVPNYLLILTVSHFLYDGNKELRHRVLLFDEAFYGIDAGRRDQLLGFASDLGLQLFVASPDLDGVKQEIPCSTTLLVIKDEECNVHLFPCNFTNLPQLSLFEGAPDLAAAEFSVESGAALAGGAGGEL